MSLVSIFDSLISINPQPRRKFFPKNRKQEILYKLTSTQNSDLFIQYNKLYKENFYASDLGYSFFGVLAALIVFVVFYYTSFIVILMAVIIGVIINTIMFFVFKKQPLFNQKNKKDAVGKTIAEYKDFAIGLLIQTNNKRRKVANIIISYLLTLLVEVIFLLTIVIIFIGIVYSPIFWECCLFILISLISIYSLYTQMQDGREFSEGLIYLLSVDKSKRDEITLYLQDNFTITGKINWIWPELEIVDKKGRIMKIEWEDIKYITVKLAQYKLKQFPSLL